MRILIVYMGLAFALTQVGTVNGQGGGGGPVAGFCGVKIADVSCASRYNSVNVPPDQYCTGLCQNNKCVDHLTQQQHVSNNAWKKLIETYTLAEPEEPGVVVLNDPPYLCSTGAPCKCAPNPQGNGICFTDLFNAIDYTIAKYTPTTEICSGEL